MANYNSVNNIVPGDIVACLTGQSTSEAASNPTLFQLSNSEPHQKVFNSSVNIGTAAASYPGVSPDGKYLVYTQGYSVAICNLENSTVTVLPVSMTVVLSPIFTGDSSTVLCSTTGAPFIIAIDLATATLKGTISGTYTFTSQQLRGDSYDSFCLLVNNTSGSSSVTNTIYKYDPSTNSISTFYTFSGLPLGGIAISRKNRYALVSSSTSNAYSRHTFINLDNTSDTLSYNGGAGRQNSIRQTIVAGENCDTAVFMPGASAQLFYLDIVKTSTIANLTITALTVTGTRASSDQEVISTSWSILFRSSTAPGNASSVRYVNLAGHTPGASITEEVVPGLNAQYSGIAVVPGMAYGKFAGHVYDDASNPVAREVIVMERRTKRVIARGMSSAVDGSFLIRVYTTSQCVVMALGTGTEVTKLVDYVAPVRGI